MRVEGQDPQEEEFGVDDGAAEGCVLGRGDGEGGVGWRVGVQEAVRGEEEGAEAAGGFGSFGCEGEGGEGEGLRRC